MSSDIRLCLALAGALNKDRALAAAKRGRNDPTWCAGAFPCLTCPPEANRWVYFDNCQQETDGGNDGNNLSQS